MADPITIGAVGWSISAVGWLVSPIISKLINKAFALLDLKETKQLKILDAKVLQLQRAMEVIDESTYRVHLEPLLNKVKSALYEAEDILDSVEYESLKKQIQDAKSDRSNKLMKNLRSAMTSSALKDEKSGMSKLELKKSLKKIGSAISEACEILEQLNLPSVSTDNGGRSVGANSRSSVTTAHPPLRVIGRDQERDKIIAMLRENEVQCQENTVSGKCYSVIGIHGMAGSGKSTLAQCVYDHEKKYMEAKLEGHFDLVIWIHVSQKFDLDSILREMSEGATEEACPNFNSRNVLKKTLEDKLLGKQIFLVLDDVWCNIRNARDCEELQKILSPVNVGKAGIKILVTSRTADALVALGAVEERRIPISNLDDNVFLELFMSYALPNVTVGGKDRRKLEMIGEDIAKKLKRSPLAARIVGSRLGLKPNFEFWRREKNQNLMSETMGALRWSYQYFDEQVRRCFTYCSIFPRGHHLKRDELVKLWMAEGFIKTSMPEEEMEDVAQYYFDELLSASFLQLGGKEASGAVDYFTIHDLLCDLAAEVAGRDCFRIEKGCTRDVPQDVRYLFVGADYIDMLTDKISGLQNLRTLIIGERIEVRETECEVFASMFATLMGLQKLRALKLHLTGLGLATFSFPDSIGQLKHLRYFAFCMDGPSWLTIPGAFTKLYLLQVVEFGKHTDLVFPGDMMNLVSLRHVCASSHWLSSLHFPNIGRLTWLQTLPKFTVMKKQGYESHQLKHLNKLQGKLQIHGLENVKSKGEALEVNLAGKERLSELVLVWDDESCSSEVKEEVLEGLCPSKYLERLEIWGFQSWRLPNWLIGEHNGGPKNLQELKIDGRTYQTA